MSCFCTNCGNNWAKLHSEDDEVNDESVEFCPLCRNDQYLVDAVEGPRYMLSLTGELIDVDTQKVVVTQKEVSLPKPVKTVHKTWNQIELEREAREDNAIDAYHKVLESEGEEAAKEAYYKILKCKK